MAGQALVAEGERQPQICRRPRRPRSGSAWPAAPRRPTPRAAARRPARRRRARRTSARSAATSPARSRAAAQRGQRPRRRAVAVGERDADAPLPEVDAEDPAHELAGDGDRRSRSRRRRSTVRSTRPSKVGTVATQSGQADSSTVAVRPRGWRGPRRATCRGPAASARPGRGSRSAVAEAVTGKLIRPPATTAGSTTRRSTDPSTQAGGPASTLARSRSSAIVRDGVGVDGDRPCRSPSARGRRSRPPGRRASPGRPSASTAPSDAGLREDRGAGRRDASGRRARSTKAASSCVVERRQRRVDVLLRDLRELVARAAGRRVGVGHVEGDAGPRPCGIDDDRVRLDVALGAGLDGGDLRRSRSSGRPGSPTMSARGHGDRRVGPEPDAVRRC